MRPARLFVRPRQLLRSCEQFIEFILDRSRRSSSQKTSGNRQIALRMACRLEKQPRSRGAKSRERSSCAIVPQTHKGHCCTATRKGFRFARNPCCSGGFGEGHRTVHHRPIDLARTDDPGAAQFQISADRVRTGCNATIPVNGQDGPVIGDQRGMPSQRLGFGQAGEGRAAFSRTRRPQKQKAGLADNDRRCMHRFTGGYRDAGHLVSAGSSMMNRAPAHVPGSLPAIFSAVRLPPCASMIWRLIERPRPEFWPKSSPSGRSV